MTNTAVTSYPTCFLNNVSGFLRVASRLKRFKIQRLRRANFRLAEKVYKALRTFSNGHGHARQLLRTTTNLASPGWNNDALTDENLDLCIWKQNDLTRILNSILDDLHAERKAS